MCKSFFSTWAERHVFLIGLFEVLCPWRAARAPSPKSEEEVDGEDHYYMGGRALGFVILLFTLVGIAKLIQEVLL